MSKGAQEEFWDAQRLPGVLKHSLLHGYLPVFVGKTGQSCARVVYLDGYAGRGRFTDGSPAAPERVMQLAETHHTNGNIELVSFFIERDDEHAKALEALVAEYRVRGVTAEARHSEAIQELDKIVAQADDAPLFIFLDPCGLGIPFTDLTAALTGKRAKAWPPTEVLLNFSLEAVRRIGGHVSSAQGNEKTMAGLDSAVGGDWWRSLFDNGTSDEAVDAVVDGFTDRLRTATGMHMHAVPVRRNPSHKPIYTLVFGTRNPLGLWHFGDQVARATQAWWDTIDLGEQTAEEETGEYALFPSTQALHPSLEDVETESIPVIAENIRKLLARVGPFVVRDHCEDVFGPYLGRVREKVVRAAIKDLHSRGLTGSDGKGKKVEALQVIPPQ